MLENVSEISWAGGRGGCVAQFGWLDEDRAYGRPSDKGEISAVGVPDMYFVRGRFRVDQPTWRLLGYDLGLSPRFLTQMPGLDHLLAEFFGIWWPVAAFVGRWVACSLIRALLLRWMEFDGLGIWAVAFRIKR